MKETKKVMSIIQVKDEVHFCFDNGVAARLIVSNIKDDKEKLQEFIKNYISSKASYFGSLLNAIKIVDYDDEKFEKELLEIVLQKSS